MTSTPITSLTSVVEVPLFFSPVPGAFPPFSPGGGAAGGGAGSAPTISDLFVVSL